MTLSIPWGAEGRLEFALPAAWELVAHAAPVPAPAAEPLKAELRRALAEPFGVPPLARRSLSGRRVAIVAEDGTRPAPTADMLEVLLGELDAAGAAAADMVLLPGLGVHRPMSAAELDAKYGPAAARLRVVQPDVRRRADYVGLGELSRGLPLELHREVAGADLVILVGTVEPHVQAGFGGGAKMLLPGVASAACIARAHLLGSPARLVQLAGRPPERNPMRAVIDAVPARLRGEVFLFNVVLNPELRVTRAFAGTVAAAHAAAVKTAAGIYGVRMSGPADVVVSGSRPMDRDWRQGVKCFGGPLFAVRPGGVLIAAMRNIEGLGDWDPPFRRPPPRWLIRAAAVLPVTRALLRLLAGSGRGLNPENLHMVFYAMQMTRRCRVVIYSPTIGRREAAQLPLFDFAPSMEEALAMAGRHVAARPVRLAVFPCGSITYPVFPEAAT
jgi:nickel-dependent lactate racemase